MLKNMVYVVSLGYSDFVFKDGKNALAFARIAKRTFEADEYNKTIKVSITIKTEEENE